MTTNGTTYLTELHQLLNQHFNLADIQDLCFRLNVDYESIPGDEKSSRIWALLLGLGRNGRLPELVTLARQQRPNVTWSPVPDNFQLPESLASGGTAVSIGTIEAGILNQGGIQYFEAPVEIDMSETTINSQGDVVQGDQVIMSGDFRGAIVNVKSQLDQVTQTINALPYGSDKQKQAFNQLLEQLKEELEKAPAEQAKEAEKVSKRVEALARELDEEEPDKEMVEITGESLKKAAQNIATVLPNVIDIATKIVAAALAFWA